MDLHVPTPSGQQRSTLSQGGGDFGLEAIWYHRLCMAHSHDILGDSVDLAASFQLARN